MFLNIFFGHRINWPLSCGQQPQLIASCRAAIQAENRLPVAGFFCSSSPKGEALDPRTALWRQACVCSRLAEECDDRHLAERLEMMALDLIAKADELEQLPAGSVNTKSCIS